MPRGRPKKTAAQAELLPPEETDQPKVREIKHTTQWIEAVPVGEAPDADTDEGLEFVEVEERQRRKKTTKDERDELRREMDKLGVASVSRLKLSIDKYRHSDSDDSGTLAEKDYCTKYPVTKAHILDDEYMDVARRYGAGRYWFTLRMDNKIVRQWERTVNQAVMPTGSVIQHANPNDPTSPQVIVNIPEGAQQPVGVVDPWKQMRELAKTYKELKQTFEPEGAQAPTPQRSEEEVLTTAILKQPEVIENVVGSVMKRFGAKGGDSDPWAEVAMEAVKNGQAAQIVREVVNGIFNGFQSFIPGRQQNGQTQVSAPPLQNQGGSGPNGVSSPQGFPQGQESLPQSVSPGLPASNMGGTETHTHTPTPTPEGQALNDILNYVVSECAKQTEVRLVAGGIEQYIDTAVSPFYQGSIWAKLDNIALMPTEAVIEFVKGFPGGEQIAALPHAKEWTAELQRLIKESQEGDEE